MVSRHHGLVWLYSVHRQSQRLSCHTAYVLYYCDTVEWTWRDWSPILRTFLQCFDIVGWVIWPVKPVPDMTYNVFGGTLNLTQSINQRMSDWWLHQRWLQEHQWLHKPHNHEFKRNKEEEEENEYIGGGEKEESKKLSYPQRKRASNMAILYGAEGISIWNRLGIDHECDRQTAYVQRRHLSNQYKTTSSYASKVAELSSAFDLSLTHTFGWTPKLRTTKCGLKKLEKTLYRTASTYLHTIISFCQGACVWWTDGRTDGRTVGTDRQTIIHPYPYPYIRIKIPVDKSQREYM